MYTYMYRHILWNNYHYSIREHGFEKELEGHEGERKV